MKLSVVRSIDEFADHFKRTYVSNDVGGSIEENLVKGQTSGVLYEAYCRVCETNSSFRVDFNESSTPQPNWRETLVCEICQLNNRLRYAADCLKFYLRMHVDDRIYLTEQLTPFFRWAKQHYPKTIGSEFLEMDLPSGTILGNQRHEDLTQLSFADNSLDFIVSFDVFEHIPNYKLALSECMRCLYEGGKLVFSVPFRADSYETLVRAKLNNDGSITHLLSPEYHGDPVKSGEGILCFYHFGWDLLDHLKKIGATDVFSLIASSSQYGYLGPQQLLFVAIK